MNINKSLIYPDMAFVKQTLYKSKLIDIPADLLSTLLANSELHKTKPGETVAVAVGSRGIDIIDLVLHHCLNFLKSKGLKPFIIPAMGSHGGATAQGQKDVLAHLGITEASMEVPIVSDMDVSCIGKLSNGLDIFFSKPALKADHIVIINRVKPHTKFSAPIESGLCKMITIGLGKADGAAEFHRQAVTHTFKIIEDTAKHVIEKCNILFGLALIEDGYGHISHIEAVKKSSIIEREKELLKDASCIMGRIPFDHIDLLIVDFIGKNISGIGMDSNVTGRHRDIVGDFHTSPHVKRIFVRDLSPDSDGNGNGIGLADVTTKRLVDALDIEKTYINALIAISPEKAAIPMHFNNDRKALDACLSTIGLDSIEAARIVRIQDTKNLEVLHISKSIEKETLSNKNLEIISPWAPIPFDDEDNIEPLVIKPVS